MFRLINKFIFVVALLGIYQLANSDTTKQSSEGKCSPNIAHVIGNVSIICDDAKAVAALEKLVEQLESLVLSDREKTEIISEQSKTIARLVQKKSDSDQPDRYDQALEALAEGNKQLADNLLNEAIVEAEKSFRKQKQDIIELYIEQGALWFASDTQKSLSAYRRVNELEPKNLLAIRQLAYLERRIGNHLEAEKLYKSLSELSPDPIWQAISYGNLGIIYRTRGELDRAIKYHEKALAIERALARKEGMAIEYGGIGVVYQIRGELDKAIEYYEKALVIYKAHGHKEGMASDYVRLGNAYQTRGELDKAIEYHEKALVIYKALGNRAGMASAFGGIGSVYQTRGEVDKAIKYYEKALAIDKALGHKEGIAVHYGNLGSAYRKRGDVDKAIKYYEKALVINKALGHKEGIANVYGSLGLVYQTRGDLEKAIEYHEKALAINEALGIKEGMAIDYANLGVVYKTRGDLDKAKTVWEKSAALFLDIGSPNYEKVKMLLEKLDNSLAVDQR